MTTESSDPLDGIDPESVAPGAVDEAAVRAALDSSNPIVRRRGLQVCETFADADLDAVRPYLDDVAALADAEDGPTALRAIAVLDAVAETDPGALDGRLAGLAAATDADIVDVQLTGGRTLGTLAVERPALLAPHASDLVAGLRATEPDPEPNDYRDVVDNEVTRQTIREHEEDERRRRFSARRTLANVVVAVAEAEPGSVRDAVDDLVALFDDVDPSVAGSAVAATAELAVADPDAAAPASDALIDALDHDDPGVRAHAIRALGALGDDDAVPALCEVAAEDSEEEVREIATETAEYLDDGE